MATVDLIAAIAEAHGVDPDLAVSVAVQESGLDQAAVSPKGAIGVMQLMPETARALGVDPNDLEQNIEGGVRYLAEQLARFGGNIEAALGAYNWGPEHVASAIAQWGSRGEDWLSHAPAETENYVRSIASNYAQRIGADVSPRSARAEGSLQAGEDWKWLLGTAAVVLGLYFLADWLS